MTVPSLCCVAAQRGATSLSSAWQAAVLLDRASHDFWPIWAAQQSLLADVSYCLPDAAAITSQCAMQPLEGPLACCCANSTEQLLCVPVQLGKAP